MPPGQTIPGNLSFAVARKVLTTEDMQRLACAFLNATDNVNFDAVKAAREFGNVKPESFKRSIWVITKKIKESAEAGEDGEENGTPAVTPKRGRKRKENGDEGATPAKKKKTSAKKGKAEVEDDDDEDTGLIKPEREAEVSDDGDFV